MHKLTQLTPLTYFSATWIKAPEGDSEARGDITKERDPASVPASVTRERLPARRLALHLQSLSTTDLRKHERWILLY